VRASVNDAMRTLRADLAAAAREARAEAHTAAREATGGADGDPRVASRLRLHEAEAALGEFRSDMRDELRTAAATATLTAETVTMLTEGLNEVRRRVVAQLRG
jgi:hypothetical protein